MKQKQKVLIVDDQQINRMLLSKILDARYDVLQAENGIEAFNILHKEKDRVQAILLDLIMPEMDGYTFLEKVKDFPELTNIPIIVATQAEGKESEIKALEMGATDYITKPYHPAIILQRVVNTIALRENAILKNTIERDYLTKLYNKETFYQKVSAQVQTDTQTTYSLIYFDIERFKIVNDFFGETKGDELLMYIADVLKAFSNDSKFFAARFNADCYCICMPHDKVNELRLANYVISHVSQFEINLKLKLNFGVYVIKDPSMKVSLMCDRASLAVKNIVGKYDTYIEYFNDQLHKTILEEQEITNEMHKALMDKHFKIYVQPKFDLNNFSTIGAEALIRWHHPEKGIIPPNKFIPVFEKNGFITELDMYILEEVCIKIRELLDQNVQVVPISVNLSRADIYKPQLCENIVAILAKYNIDHHLVEFEITETSYTQDSEQLIEIVTRLRDLGFAISMDDFGTGYSSLNMLSEVPVDLIKIDMRFLKNLNENDKKTTSIIHFIVYMAKWLNLPVITEGIETIEQVEYLRSVGCYNGQGYFFSKPFPFEEYQERYKTFKFAEPIKTTSDEQVIPNSDLWSSNSRFSILFNNFACPLILIELKGDNLEIIRANKAFYRDIMENDENFYASSRHALTMIEEGKRAELLKSLAELDENKNWTEFQGRIQLPGTQTTCWHNARFTYLQKTYNSKIFIMHVDDITEYKNAELICKVQDQRMDTVLDLARIAILDINIQDKSIRLNQKSASIFGIKAETLFYPQDIIEECYLPIEQKEIFAKTMGDIFAGIEQSKKVQVSFIQNNTKRVWFELSYKIIFEETKPVMAICSFENITHAVAKREIYQHEQDFRNSIIQNGANYIEVNLETKQVTRNSKTLLGTLSYPPNRAIDSFFSLMANSTIHPEDKDKFLQFINVYSFKNLLSTGNKKYSFECRYLCPEDRSVFFKWIRINISSIVNPENGEASTFLYIDHIENNTEFLEHISHYNKDAKTGLYREDTFKDIIEQYLPNRLEKETSAVLYIGLSQDFSCSNCKNKTTNNSVVAMSNILRENFRSGDFIARVGDYAFAVLLQHVPNADCVQQRASKLCHEMNAYNENNFSNKLIGNIGVLILRGQASYTLIMENAKGACEIARKSGVNTMFMLEK